MIAKSILYGTTSLPSRVDVAKWVNAAMAEMKGKGKIIQNAWKRRTMSTSGSSTTRGNVGGDDEENKGGIYFVYQFNQIFNYYNI
jgi:hypothetical protein